jgi:4'-phosphopantetheinyl transferase
MEIPIASSLHDLHATAMEFCAPHLPCSTSDNTPLELGLNEVHLWCAFPHAITAPGPLAAYHDLLSAEEHRQYRQFSFARNRRDYLVTRALVRTVLSFYYSDTDPRDWRFHQNPYGKPEIAYPENSQQLRFNVSHTDGLIVCLVARSCEIGVDVEHTDRRCSVFELAESLFATEEIAALQALVENAQRQRFFQYWTLKEAFCKARGLGLSLPMEQVYFQFAEGRPIRVSFGPQLQDDPDNWRFVQFALPPRWIGAVAIQQMQGPHLAVQMRQAMRAIF